MGTQQAGLPGRAGHVACFGYFLLGRGMRPVEGDAKRAVSAGKGALEGFRIVDVGRDNPGPGQGLIHVAGERANGEAALGPGGSNHRDDFLIPHGLPPSDFGSCTLRAQAE